jgi:hypothetical protein
VLPSAREAVFEGHFRELGGLAGACVAADYDDGASFQRGEYLVALDAHGKFERI